MLRKKNWLLSTLLVVAFAHTPAYAKKAKAADEFDAMRAKWAARTSNVNLADPEVLIAQNAANANAEKLFASMIREEEGRTALWPDLANFSSSATLSNNFARLVTLADAYYNSTGSLRGNAAVLAAVRGGTNWLVDNYYNASKVEFGNWYDWQIGIPTHLCNLLFLLHDDWGVGRRQELLTVIDRFMPDPTYRLTPDGTGRTSVETGANRLEKAYVAVMRGMLGKDAAKVAQGRDAISETLAFVTTGDGFYTDGTFVQHLHEPYVGGYGAALLTSIARLYYLLGDSPWEVTDPNRGNPYWWAMNGFRPFMYDGAMMDNQRGRAISRATSTDHVVGRGIVVNLLALAESLPAEQGLEIKGLLKGWMERDKSFGDNYFRPPMSASDVTKLKAIVNDASIPATPDADETRIYPSGDRVVQRQPGYAFALSMFSKRMSAFEYGNGENINGWWTGMGMNYLYNADQTQYGRNFWATVDMWRLPGITTDGSGSGTPTAWKHYGNTRAGVGGAELNKRFAAVGMDFATKNVTGTALTGKKAWFLFGDKIVAVGSGITTTDGLNVETIVENRKLAADGANLLTVNGESKPVAAWSEAMPAVKWAHLAGSVPGSDIGYVFPDAPVVNGLREQRTGAWSNVNTGGSTTPVNDYYLSLALGHGVNPLNAAYTYILLPNRSAQEVADFAGNSGISVLERSTGATAVKDSRQGVTGLVFWNDSSKTVNASGQPLVTSDRKSAVVLKQAGTDLQVAIADPTYNYAGSLNIDINRSATSVVSADPNVTVLQTSPTIKLKVDVAGSAGKSYNAHFALSNLSTLYSGDDAYVRDGASAGANFGTVGTITVKADAVGFNRKGLLKFDLSGVEGKIVSASLRMTPVSVGMAGITHNLYQTEGNWSESTVTWNNRPANGALVASIAVPAANTQVQVDVSSQAKAAMDGNKLLSFAVEAAQNYGSAGSVDYASRQHANINYRPTLVVTIE